jgi:hypothetical protein
MQTRDELYDSIGYMDFERKLDRLNAARNDRDDAAER